MNPNPDFLIDRILHRDGLMLIIDKPAGMAVHAQPGTPVHRDVLEFYFEALKFGLPRPPALAHRLDRDTSGCLVLGRHPKALRRLGKLFQDGQIIKTYWAICRGKAEKPSGTIDLPLIKHNDPSGWIMATCAPGAEGAREAVTTYRTLGFANGLSLIECKPKTGRTHQLRVHLASIGLPIIGDPKYGDMIATDRAQPMMLHARAISLPLYPSKEPINAQAEPPQVMANLIAQIERA